MSEQNSLADIADNMLDWWAYALQEAGDENKPIAPEILAPETDPKEIGERFAELLEEIGCREQ
jgi:hypothetical protein